VRAEPNGRSAVVVVEGGPGEALASLISARIEAPHSVRPAQAFLAELATRGTRTLGPAIGNRARNGQLVGRIRAVSSDEHLDVAIVVAHAKLGRVMHAHLWVVDARADRAVVDEDLASTTAEGEANEVWTAVESFFPTVPAAPQTPKDVAPSVAAPPIPHEPRPASVLAEPTDAGGASGSGGSPENATRMHAMFVADVGIIAGSRHFSYVDRITPTLRPYDLFAAPLASVGAEAYPLAHARIPTWLTGIGMTGRYRRAFALASADAAGTRVGTQWQAFDVSLRERADLVRDLGIAGNFGVGVSDFDFDRSSLAAVLPSADYTFLRAGIDARGKRGDLSAFVSGAYLGVLSTGAMHGLFPRERAGGVEAEVGAAYDVTSGFEVSIAVAYTRFFYSMRPKPGDTNVAGGALDEMALLSLALAYLH
jgi:hypothetical protein